MNLDMISIQSDISQCVQTPSRVTSLRKQYVRTTAWWNNLQIGASQLLITIKINWSHPELSTHVNIKHVATTIKHLAQILFRSLFR
jgi:hypothetical protein